MEEKQVSPMLQPKIVIVLCLISILVALVRMKQTLFEKKEGKPLRRIFTTLVTFRKGSFSKRQVLLITI